ncbi:H+/gluconate symporter [Saccharopolyspora kobensis]|uniref:H+/gluconate symporter n=1 Tax=Saccharopolyspora kobensis TaxID=146035 RepID=A0A1H5VX03_9PSEU|nr:SLC13 family permease [Saccharopolyspora kobensis]SEF91815.1 H+/gluconate symporter [Saccharopolyspora kobensis]SFC55820.1 H+/gluconate symporter [Saccharopolyspora kobensis]
MSDIVVFANTAITIIGVVVLILRVKISPAIALVLGAIYLGLVSGLGPEQTIKSITTGFGDLMSEVGLLIAFGVLLGSLMASLGAIEQLVERLVRLFGPKTLPYAFGSTIGTVLQSIFADVLLVITAPLASRLSRQIGPHGAARMCAAMALGIEVGLVFVVPGVGAVALAGVLNLPFGKMFIFGLVTAVFTIVTTLALFTALAKRGLWNPKLDETEELPVADVEPAADRRFPPLALSLAPLLLALALIAFGAIAEMTGLSSPAVDFLGDPVIALLIGLVGALAIARWKLPKEQTEAAFKRGFHESGQILILTGVGGSLAQTVKDVGLGELLKDYFTTNTLVPLLLVWAVAAVLHIAVGSVVLASITAAGVLGPVMPMLGIDPVFVALAAGAGSLFVIHATSNTFWLLQTLLPQTTRGALKSVTLTVSAASVIAMIPIQLMAFLF